MVGRCTAFRYTLRYLVPTNFDLGQLIKRISASSLVNPAFENSTAQEAVMNDAMANDDWSVCSLCCCGLGARITIWSWWEPIGKRGMVRMWRK